MVVTVKEEIGSYSYPDPQTVVQYYDTKILEVLVIQEEIDAADDVVVPYYPLH